MFNAEVCYGSGLQYNTDSCGGDVKWEVEDFLLDNAMPSYFLSVCKDFKHFAFCVSVVILNADRTKIVHIERIAKEHSNISYIKDQKNNHLFGYLRICV